MTKKSYRPLINGGLACLFLGAGVLYLRISANELPVPDYMFGYWRMRHFALAGGFFVLTVAFFFAMIGRSAILAFWASFIPAFIFLCIVELVGRTGIINWSEILESSSYGGGGPGWELTPNLSVEGETYQDIAVRYGVPHSPITFKFETDNFGFRNAKIEDAEIIILGDSIVLGAQVPQEHLVDRVVNSSLGVGTVQAALLGLSIQEQHNMLLTSEIALENKLVVQFLFEGNDLLDSRRFRMSGNAKQLPGTGENNKSLLTLLWTRLVKHSNPPAQYSSCDIEGQQYLFLWTGSSFHGHMDEVKPIEEAILKFRTQIQAKGADYALVFVPTKYRVLHKYCTFPEVSLIATSSDHLSDLPEVLSIWAEGADIRYLDLTDALIKAADDGRFSWLWGDTHWNAQGHKVAGQTLSNWLK